MTWQSPCPVAPRPWRTQLVGVAVLIVLASCLVIDPDVPVIAIWFVPPAATVGDEVNSAATKSS